MASSAQADTLVKQAAQLAAEGRWPAAQEIYIRLAEIAPDEGGWREAAALGSRQAGDYALFIRVTMELADRAAAAGDLEGAMSLYQGILKLEEEVRSQGGGRGPAAEIQSLVGQVRPEILSRAGAYYLESGRLEEALEALQHSIELAPGRWEPHMVLGRAYMAKGQDKRAIGELQEVVRLAPNEAHAYELMGEVFLRAGRSPQTTVVWFRNAAELFVQRRQRSDAIRAYERILEFEQGNKEVLIQLGEIYGAQGLVQEAVRTYLTLASIYSEEGLLDKVIHFYEKLLDVDPSHEEARNQVIGIYRSILQRDPSNTSVRLRLIENLLRRGVTREAGEHQLALARNYLDRGMLEEAVPIARRLLELDPDHLEAHRLMGDLYRKKDMGSEALVEYQHVVRLHREAGNEQAALDFQHQLVELFPEASDLQYQVALALRAQGDRAGARRELQRLVQERPGDVPARIYLAEELVALREWAEAVEVYRSILAEDPGRIDVRKRLIHHFLEVGSLEEVPGHVESLPTDDLERTSFLHRLIERGFELERWAEVERHLQSLSQEDERRTLYRKQLAKVYMDRGTPERAHDVVLEIPRSDKERNRLIGRLLEEHLGGGRLDPAASFLDRLPKDDPLRFAGQRRLIGCYLEASAFERAAAELARLPEGDEALPELLHGLVTGLLSSGRLEDAGRHLEGFPEGHPARASFLAQLIEAYLSVGELDRAAVEVGRLSPAEEVGPRFRRRIIQAYLNAGRLEEAERDIRGLDDRDPEKRSFLRLLIQKFEATGRLERLREVVLSLPEDMEEKQQYLDGLVHNFLVSGDLALARQEIYQMAESVSAQGYGAEAERLYRELLAYHPADVDIRLRLSQAMAAQGKLDRAREGMLVLAGRFHREGNATSAADIYGRLLEIDPDNLNARFRLGHLWAEQGQIAQALDQFGQLAAVYLQQNLPEVAQKVLHRILELDPKDIGHRRQLVKLLTRNLRFDEATEHLRVLLGLHLDRGDVEEARACVAQITNLQPLNLELRQRLGEMFLKAGFLEEGQLFLEELVATYRGRGDHLRGVGIYQFMAETFEKHEQWDASLDFREKIADEHVEADRWPEAREVYLQVLERALLRGRKERTDPLFVKLIDGFFRHQAVPEGISLLERLEESLLDRHKPLLALSVKERLASVMERLDQWERALELFEALSRQFQVLEEWDQAISYRRRAAEVAFAHQQVGQGVELLFELACLLVSNRGLDAARPVLEELRTRTGGEPAALERIGEVLFQYGLFEEARPIYQEVLALEPDRVASLSRVAVLLSREGRLEEAAEVARQVLARGLVGQILEEFKAAVGYVISDAASRLRMGHFYRQMGSMEEAIAEFQAAAADPGKVLDAYSALACCFEEKGYPELAIRQFQKALEQPGYSDAELLDIRYRLAGVLESSGRYKEALQAFQECYAEDILFRDVAQRIEALIEKIQSVRSDGERSQAGRDEEVAW